MLAPTLMVQGTASSAGKSLLVTALCRIFLQEGLRVAPFKSQNMALNSFVTPDGLEIGRAQAVQAEACGVPPAVEMNPILLKPEGDARAQVVVLGKPLNSMTAVEYQVYKPELVQVLSESLERLRRDYDLVIIEGAGSPAEINLRDHDIVNMRVAHLADAPVLLVGDIDRGGVFAAFVGTLELLEAKDRARIAAFIVNKFRGDVSLLQPGLEYLTNRTQIPVLGVVPFIQHLRLADEDSVSLESRRQRRRARPDQLDIAVVRFPRIANYDDLEPLEYEPGVVVRFVEYPEEAQGADLLVLPGSKNTVADLAWLRQSGLAEVIEERVRSGAAVLGICGGCQMLGQTLEDHHGVESQELVVEGLGALSLKTRFEKQKITSQIKAHVLTPSFLTEGIPADAIITGYEIHMGLIKTADPAKASFEVLSRNGKTNRAPDGATSANGAVVGTMIHGIFENDSVRSALLTSLRKRKGLPEPVGLPAIPKKEEEYDRLAEVVRHHIDLELLHRIVGLP